MNVFCISCGMPLTGEDGRDYRGSLCLYCSDEKGQLLPRELVKRGIAEWLKQISGNTGADFNNRADHYMKAMPAWAEEETGV